MKKSSTTVNPGDRHFTQRVRLSYAVSIGLNVFAVVLLLVSMTMEGWFYWGDASTYSSTGLNKECTKSLCTQIKYNDVNLGICTRSGSQLNSRIGAVKWLLYVSIAVAFVSMPVYGYGSVKDARFITLGTGLNVLSFALEFISLIVFVHSTHSWIFCDLNFCEYKARICAASTVPSTCDSSCFSGYGAPFIMAACATVLFLVAVLWSVVSTIVRNSRRDVMNKILQSRGFSSAPVDFQAPSGFEFDSESGLFYSWSMQLYLDPVSCHYYDPHSGLWYNPDNETWYSLQA